MSATPVLEVRDLHRSFGGVHAVSGCSLNVNERSVTGLIGPNGSGKTTMLNLISGQLEADGGRVLFRGRDVTALPPDSRSRLGMGRTFQLVRVFLQLTVLENMLAASRTRSFVEATRRALELLDLVKLTPLRDSPGGHLSYGQRKLLEFARVLMLDPDLLLLDEPFAGVNRVLAGELADLVVGLSHSGRTVVVIDHEMRIIKRICDQLIVMDHGQILVSGPTSQIETDPRVMDAYFGKA